MDRIIFAMPGNEIIANTIASKLQLPVGEMELRSFPDAETYIRILSDVA